MKTDVWWGEVDYTGPCQESRDTDCDHWYDEHDNCAWTFNPGQEDTDDDGRGDACDNCVTASNPLQENCNLDSERAHKPRVGPQYLGDACDPVPCPLSELGGARIAETCTDFQNPDLPCSPDAAACNCEGRRLVSTLRSTPIGPNNNTVVPNVETSARFCQEQVSETNKNGKPRPEQEVINCHRDTIKSNDQLAFDEPPNPAHPWHNVTFGKTTAPFYSPPPRGATLRWDYGSTTDINSWFYSTDSSFWFDRNLIALPNTFPECLTFAGGGTCLRGVFWLNGNTSVGGAIRGESVDRPSEYANFYLNWEPDRGTAYCLIHPLAGVTFARANNASSFSSVPANAATGEFLWPSTGIARSFAMTLTPQTLFVEPTTFGIVGALKVGRDLVALSKDGSGCGGDAIEPPIARRISSFKWLSVVEPTTNIGSLPSNLMAVALSSDATCLSATLVEDNGRLTLNSWDEIDTRAFATGRSCGSVMPPARAAYTGVFSREAGGVFVMGGEDASGRLLHDVWFRPVYGPWTEISTGAIALGNVLAATYAFADDHLWVLDEVTDPKRSGRQQSRVRLLRIHPAGGASVVFSAPRTRSHAESFLSVDYDGSPLLAVTAEKKFSVYRVIAKPHRQIIRHLDDKRGKLVRAPIVDPYGYSFVLGEDDGSLRLDRIDHPLQPPRPTEVSGRPAEAWWKRSWKDRTLRDQDTDGEHQGEFETLF
jgi:hypothetical protein